MKMKNFMLALSLMGIFILIILVNTQEPKQLTQISFIDDKHLNKEIKITGQIISIKEYQNEFKSILINDNSSEIPIICECRNINKTLLKKQIEVIGKVTEFQNNLEIQANKIILLD